MFQRRNGYAQAKRRNYHKLSPAQREAMIRRTVYVSDIDHQVSKDRFFFAWVVIWNLWVLIRTVFSFSFRCYVCVLGH